MSAVVYDVKHKVNLDLVASNWYFTASLDMAHVFEHFVFLQLCHFYCCCFHPEVVLVVTVERLCFSKVLRNFESVLILGRVLSRFEFCLVRFFRACLKFSLELTRIRLEQVLLWCVPFARLLSR